MVFEGSRLASLARLIKGTHTFFEAYRDGIFYMRIMVLNRNNSENVKDWTQEIYQFSIPAHELEGRMVLPKDRSVRYHRWIRAAVAEDKLLKIDTVKLFEDKKSMIV